MILPDVNLLLYAIDDQSPSYRVAHGWLRSLLNGTETVALPWAVSVSFLRLATNARVMERPLTFVQASELVDSWLGRPSTTVIAPTRRHTAILRDLLGSLGTAANLVPDAHLAALAIEHGAELCSADNDFSRFPGLSWHNPLITP